MGQSGLVGAAEGKVWQMTLPTGSKVEGDFTIISTLHQGASVQYRVVGDAAPEGGAAVAAAPSLEDSYVWLMRERHVAAPAK